MSEEGGSGVIKSDRPRALPAVRSAAVLLTLFAVARRICFIGWPLLM